MPCPANTTGALRQRDRGLGAPAVHEHVIAPLQRLLGLRRRRRAWTVKVADGAGLYRDPNHRDLLGEGAVDRRLQSPPWRRRPRDSRGSCSPPPSPGSGRRTHRRRGSRRAGRGPARGMVATACSTADGIGGSGRGRGLGVRTRGAAGEQQGPDHDPPRDHRAASCSRPSGASTQVSATWVRLLGRCPRRASPRASDRRLPAGAH